MLNPPSRKSNLAAISIAAGIALVFFIFAVGHSASAATAQPDLAVALFGTGSDPRPITAPGQSVGLAIGLDNLNGAADAHHVTLSAVLPNGLNFQGSEPAPTRVEGRNRLFWEIDTLPAKASPRIFQVTAQTETNLAAGSRLEISAEAESSEGNVDATHHHAKYTIYVQPAGPDLVFLGSTLDSVPLTADGPASFQVNLTNAGNLPATDTHLEVTLPKGVNFDKADPQPESSKDQVVTFKLGDLARGESKSVSMNLHLDPLQLSDLSQSDRPLAFAFRLSRMASGAEVTDSHFQITKHVESAGQDVAVWLTMEGAKEPGEVSPDSDVACVVQFANLGNAPAQKVVVTVNLGPGLALAHSEPQPSATAASDLFPGGVVRWNVGDLDVGMAGSIRSTVHVSSVPEEGALLNATITADGIDIDTTNNTATLIWHSPLGADTLKAMHQASGNAKVESVPARRGHSFLRLILFAIVVGVVLWISLRARRSGAGG